MPKSVISRRSFDLDAVLSRLSYTVETVLEAAVEQASLFERVAHYRVEAMRSRLVLEMELERLKADLELSIRKQAADIDEKITEGAIKARIAANGLVQMAQNRLSEAEAQEEYAKLLLEAYRHRRDSLEVVAQQSSAERSMSRLVEEGLNETRRQLAGKYRG